MILDYEKMSELQVYKAMSQSIIPRPIAWIVTQDEGVVNAAPFSYFAPLSSSPATVIVSIGHKEDGSEKDTLANIRKTKKATICFVNEANLEDVKKTANEHPKEESEVVIYNIATTKLLQEYPPAISSAQSALFCDFHSEVALKGETVPLILEIKHQYVDESCVDGKNHIILENVGRIGKTFARLEGL
jgi:flavin reductase (DIM6/NTAB) family NADH-FMN oxidoreductase RutF